MTRFVLIAFLNVLFCYGASGQSTERYKILERFMRTEGLGYAAFYAHPLDAIDGDHSKVYFLHDEAVFHIRYKSGNQTVLKVVLRNGIIRDVVVLYDSHMISAFVSLRALEAFTGGPTSQMPESIEKRIREYYETYVFKKALASFNYQELAATMLSNMWAYFAKREGLHLDKVVPRRNSTPQEVKFIDGVRVEGTSIFIERIEKALRVIKDYDPALYDENFDSSDGNQVLLRGIAANSSSITSTIDDDWYILISNSYTNSNDTSRDNQYVLAAIIIHELQHLTQAKAYSWVFKTTVDAYLSATAQDPVIFAEREMNASEIQINFMKKVLYENDRWGKHISSKSDLATRRELNKTLKKTRDLNSIYNELRTAGLLMFGTEYYNLIRDFEAESFETEAADRTCLSECKAKACAAFKSFDRRLVNDIHRDIENYYSYYDHLICR